MEYMRCPVCRARIKANYVPPPSSFIIDDDGTFITVKGPDSSLEYDSYVSFQCCRDLEHDLEDGLERLRWMAEIEKQIKNILIMERADP